MDNNPDIDINRQKLSRKLPRSEPNQTITVINCLTGENFGELANLSMGGIMIITDQLIPTDAIFQLSLQLPTTIQNNDQLHIGADCLWSRKVDHFHRYWSGFQIIDIAPSAQQQLEALIADYSKITKLEHDA